MKPFLNSLRGRASLLMRAFSPYESANPSIRRSQVPGPSPTDARRELTPPTRRELLRRSRYLHKNSGFFREVVADMAIYSTGAGIRLQAQSQAADWNQKAEEYFTRWASRPEITGRFSFEEVQHLVCRGIDMDGEYFVLKVRDALGLPRLQLLESHRVGDANGKTDTVDGILFDDYGAPLAYRVLQDDGTSRDVEAWSVLHIFEPEQVSSVRAAPILQHSINHLLDEMELLALEKHAVKSNSDISRVLKVDSGSTDDQGDFKVSVPGGSGEESTTPEEIERIVGGKVVGLKPHESLEAFQPNRPSPVFTGFLKHLERDSSAGVLPYEFVMDSSSVGGAGVRLIVAKADRRFSYRQMVLIQRFLRPVWGYVIGDAIDRGVLSPITDWHKVSFTTPRRITVDAGREAQQNRADVETGLKSLSQHYEELGGNFEEEVETRGRDAKRILETAAKYGVPVEMLWKPQGGAPAIGVPSGGDEEEPKPPVR